MSAGFITLLVICGLFCLAGAGGILCALFCFFLYCYFSPSDTAFFIFLGCLVVGGFLWIYVGELIEDIQFKKQEKKKQLEKEKQTEEKRALLTKQQEEKRAQRTKLEEQKHKKEEKHAKKEQEPAAKNECVVQETDYKQFLVCHLAGRKFHDADKVWNYLKPGTALQLKRENGNPHDSNAVAVLFHNPDDGKDYRIGYIPRELNETIASMLDMGWTDVFQCIINSINPDKHPEHQIYLTINITRHP